MPVQVKAKGPLSEEDSSIAAQLMRLQDPNTGQVLADKYLLPQISVLFWAGFDTTGNTMAWTLFCVSQHPEVCLQLPTLSRLLDCPQFSIRLKPIFSPLSHSSPPPHPPPSPPPPPPTPPPPIPRPPQLTAPAPPPQILRKNCCTIIHCSVACSHIQC